MSEPDPPFEFAYVGALVPDRPPFIAPPFSRSANLYQAQMLEGMAQAGLRPSLILSFTTAQAYPRDRRLWVKGDQVTDEWANHIEILGFPNITPIKQGWLGLASFVRLVRWSLERRGTPRLIHSYNLTTPSGIFLWAAARLTGAHFSASLNDIEVPGHTVPDSPLFRFDHWMHRFLIPRLDARVVVADAIAEDFAPDADYLRVEGGVGDDLVARTKNLRAARPAGPTPFRLVAVGKIDETNGFDLMLEAMRLMPDVEVVLDVAGSGPLADQVEEAARQDPRIRMHGFLSLDAVFKLYGQADLILVIRRTQTRNTRYFFPGKLMEALLSGIPVLATDTGHLKEEYGNWLYLLDEETAPALATRIREIAAESSAARAGLAERARARMISAKSWRSQGRRLVDYLRARVVSHG